MPDPVFADSHDDGVAGPRDDLGTEVSVTNEFTSVRVRKVLTRNGERLRITSPKLGFAVDLDPLELESLTWQTAETFSRMLHSPYGPEEPVARSLLDLRQPGGRSDRDGHGSPGDDVSGGTTWYGIPPRSRPVDGQIMVGPSALSALGCPAPTTTRSRDH